MPAAARRARRSWTWSRSLVPLRFFDGGPSLHLAAGAWSISSPSAFERGRITGAGWPRRLKASVHLGRLRQQQETRSPAHLPPQPRSPPYAGAIPRAGLPSVHRRMSNAAEPLQVRRASSMWYRLSASFYTAIDDQPQAEEHDARGADASCRTLDSRRGAPDSASEGNGAIRWSTLAQNAKRYQDHLRSVCRDLDTHKHRANFDRSRPAPHPTQPRRSRLRSAPAPLAPRR